MWKSISDTSGLLKRLISNNAKLKYFTFAFIAFIFPKILTIFKPLPVKLTLVVGFYTAKYFSMLANITWAKEKQQLCLKYILSQRLFWAFEIIFVLWFHYQIKALF